MRIPILLLRHPLIQIHLTINTTSISRRYIAQKMRTVSLFFLLLATAITAKWTPLVKLLEIGHRQQVFVSSVYHDPTSGINHVLISDRPNRNYWVFSVHDDGTILHTTHFKDYSIAYTGIIRGAGDGKHLYLALFSEPYGRRGTTNFTESSDGGETWSKPIIITESGLHKPLQDMLYIPESGRLFVFITTENNELKMVTRPPGSSVFSSEVLIATGVRGTDLVCRATYNFWLNRPMVHVFFPDSSGRLKYVKSINNGATWTDPKEVGNEYAKEVTGVVSNSKISNTIYVAYTVNSGPARIIKTEDYGATFSGAKPLTQKTPYNEYVNDGMALCGTKDLSMLTSFFAINEANPEYSFVDTATLEVIPKEHPFTFTPITNTGLDCVIDTTRSLLNVTMVAIQPHADHTNVLFAQESDFFPVANLDNQDQCDLRVTLVNSFMGIIIGCIKLMAQYQGFGLASHIHCCLHQVLWCHLLYAFKQKNCIALGFWGFGVGIV
eukprot:TRINITY_DN64991_c0_g1_i1.p1 TRINITY_DN64991_c0_g1~~TRINITY_DN64991_c0_g1_i1.p1  ORF type:complete len:495 (+),score=-5.73 TRINITY_DN64991_c0_g1_i1:121-1605(+)